MPRFRLRFYVVIFFIFILRLMSLHYAPCHYLSDAADYYFIYAPIITMMLRVDMFA